MNEDKSCKRLSWKHRVIMQIILAMVFSFLMHIPQFFNRQDWTCDVYGSSVTNSTTDNGKNKKLFY